MSIHQLAAWELEKLTKQAEILEKQIAKAPKGELRCHKDRNGYRWFLIEGQGEKGNKIRRYLSKKTDRVMAEKLALKAYHKRRFRKITREMRALKKYLHMISDQNLELELLEETSGYRELLLPMLSPAEQKNTEWKNEEYQKNPMYPEKRKIKAADGQSVRSKSEAMIIKELMSDEIPYRYECALDLGGYIVYPDFMIRHPVTGKLYIWEHFGMIDQEEYLENMMGKLKRYIHNGYIPGDNLIMTFETSDNPLGYDMICRTVREYFDV